MTLTKADIEELRAAWRAAHRVQAEWLDVFRGAARAYSPLPPWPSRPRRVDVAARRRMHTDSNHVRRRAARRKRRWDRRMDRLFQAYFDTNQEGTE
jgi:hypothetical protein